VMVVNPALPVQSMAELVRYAKANPGQLNYGNAVGIAPHFLVELFKRKTGADIVHVPYRGGAPMIADLLGGQIQMTINGKSVLLPHIREGKLRPIGVTAAARWPELPDVPTLVEGGYLDVPYDTLFGIVAPAGTPAAVIARLNTAVNDALAAPDIRASLARLGIEGRSGTPADFAAAIAQEVPKWAEIVRVTGIKAAE
jgi:tripartite-type tricarboxylate transporter receptor subunit TctC